MDDIKILQSLKVSIILIIKILLLEEKIIPKKHNLHTKSINKSFELFLFIIASPLTFINLKLYLQIKINLNHFN
jgi:hypothetical protein